MNRRTFFPASFLALLLSVLTFGIAMAHTGIQVGHYEVEIGWVDEPVIVGQRNAILIIVTDSNAKDAPVDVSGLSVNITYGGQTKSLALAPRSEDSKNQYIAPIIPTIAGQYTVQLRGKLGDSDVDIDVEPEEVTPADALTFPNTSNAPTQPAPIRLVDWVGIGALVVALAALVLSLRKPRP